VRTSRRQPHLPVDRQAGRQHVRRRTAVRWLGLKDEDGVTTQLLSLAAALSGEDKGALAHRLAEQRGPGWITVERIIGHGRSHASRHALIGNSFRVALRGLDAGQLDYLVDIGEQRRIVVFPNYYDSQRFGVVGSGVANSHLIGEHLIADEPEAAYREFLRSGNSPERKRELTAALEQTGDHRTAFARIDRRLVQFLLDAAASHRWNAALSEALGHSGPVHTVPALDGVQDLNVCRVDERAVPPVLVVPSTDLDPDATDGLRLQPASHRRLSTQPTRLRVTPIPEDGRGAVLEFFLPRGTYATMLVKHLLWAHETGDR
jgi:tRNA pseudouridine13 synthase